MQDKHIGHRSSGIIRSIVAFIRNVFRFRPAAPQIDSFMPIRATPGAVLVIHGHHFSNVRERNLVKVGGVPAHVVEAGTTRLKIVTAIATPSGPLEVEVDGMNAGGPVEFEALDWPDQRSEDGPPILYTGAGKGGNGKDMPSVGDLPVLVVLCQPADLTPPDADAVRDSVIAIFEQVCSYYHQASYGRARLLPTVTAGWCTLDHNHDYYFTELPDGRSPLANYSGIYPQAARFASGEVLGSSWTPEQELDYLTGFVLIAPVVYLGREGAEARADDDTDLLQYSDLGIDIVNPSSLWSRIVVEDAADWRTWAHEIGHCMVSNPVGERIGEEYGEGLGPWRWAAVLAEDLYEVGGADASAADFDLMGHHHMAPLFSAYYMEQLGYYNAENIHTCSRLDPAAADFNDEFIVVAHGDHENENPDRCHLVKIRVGHGLYYYIEVRQRPAPDAVTRQLFDEHIPVADPADTGGVIVTKVFTGTVNMNQQMRFVTLLHTPRVLTLDAIVRDPARRLQISVVDDHVEDLPLACRVRIEWSAAGAVGSGDVSLRIEPWNSDYATPDIWIDRAPFGEFDSDNPELGLDPDGNRDRPRVDEVNHFYGRVHCDGPPGVAVTDVQMTFYMVTPPGVGDNGNWAPLETRGIPEIETGSSGERLANWVPEIGEHTCLKLYASATGPGGETLECSAQENVFEFLGAAEGSLPAIVEFPLAVRNPRKMRALVLLSLRNVPQGFVAQIPHAWVWLEPLQERCMTLTIVPTRHCGQYHDKLPIPYARIKLSGWLSRDYHEALASSVFAPSALLPMGGISARVTPKRTCSLRLWEVQKSTPSDVLELQGGIDAVMHDEVVHVYLDDPAGRRCIVRVTTDGSGQFRAAFDLTRKPSLDARAEPEKQQPLDGIYVAQAFIINSPQAAQAGSNIVYIRRA